VPQFSVTQTFQQLFLFTNESFLKSSLIEAFQRAIELGANTVEPDVRLTAKKFELFITIQPVK
jgi:hypothetical protein